MNAGVRTLLTKTSLSVKIFEYQQFSLEVKMGEGTYDLG